MCRRGKCRGQLHDWFISHTAQPVQGRQVGNTGVEECIVWLSRGVTRKPLQVEQSRDRWGQGVPDSWSGVVPVSLSHGLHRLMAMLSTSKRPIISFSADPESCRGGSLTLARLCRDARVRRRRGKRHIETGPNWFPGDETRRTLSGLALMPGCGRQDDIHLVQPCKWVVSNKVPCRRKLEFLPERYQKLAEASHVRSFWSLEP